jgi:hypothetical protein
MRLLLTFCLGLLLALPGQAQERVRNVRVSVVDSSQLEIRYDLITTRPGDSIYIQVRSRLRGVLRILPEFVQGDVGTGMEAGSDRRIIWNALANGYSLNEEIRATVLVKSLPATAVARQPAPAKPTAPKKESPKLATMPDSTISKPKPGNAIVVTQPRPATVTPSQPPKVEQPAAVQTDTVPVTKPAVATPTPQRTEPVATKPAETNPSVTPADSARPRMKTRYVGPAWALLSAVAPGIGNIFVQLPKPKVGIRPLLTVVCYGAVAYGLIERQKSRDDYAIYEQQKNVTAGEPYYQTANDHHHRYYLATRGAMVVAAADVILTFIRGVRNSQLMKEARRYQGLMIRPGLQAGQPTAVVRYSF